MKIKGLRWYIIGLIMVITIINYLDRGTLNYMWVANIDYELTTQQPIDIGSNVAVKQIRAIAFSLLAAMKCL